MTQFTCRVTKNHMPNNNLSRWRGWHLNRHVANMQAVKNLCSEESGVHVLSLHARVSVSVAGAIPPACLSMQLQTARCSTSTRPAFTMPTTPTL
jgi:hypothetical protein